MKKIRITLRLQPLLDEARKVADAEGVALNQLIDVALAEKLSAVRTKDYFRERTARANMKKAFDVLSRAGKSQPPVAGDETL